ncbi:hypothetical protein EYM_03950 [Ignicoccus islandicus DSM 13165]|uniref:Uncharacterized protein n=1 Tax=Ignicoccus islandicus DSM 13165 TaxID=940295 RepID=A0A0U3F4H8_9CREN|nr:ribbon-helix-helix protein, CopG family [Ignicoccus islandicus]ALU12453.1 hypothetical protein EYM_03950 [Ignicoccus islandicus DSM 13165]
MTRYVLIKLPEELYEELEKRAREEGYTLVSDFVRDIINRELGKTPFNPRKLEQRIERIENGDLPPRLQDAIWRLIEEALSAKLASQLPLDEVSSVESLEKLNKKIEREIQKLLIPWTEKIDDLAKRIAQLTEELEEIKEKVNTEKTKEEEEVSERKQRRMDEHKERRRFTALDRLKAQGIIFESDLRTIKFKDSFFEKLRKGGAKILTTSRYGRIAVHPDVWEKFLEVLNESTSGDDAEVLEKLDSEALKMLFSALREDGLLIFDRSLGRWVLEESVE